ncbi:uncharacterized protein LOC127285386 [Leptopilina boulardi]|uniref:uncharacterized protein LOC127285386 n=1 Tax=Leptopilina boulardi TaxID=63433 RepID=UPI0021F553CF|nr:uncharacterized protein LOC127285386 [Leptopilina boulardi]
MSLREMEIYVRYICTHGLVTKPNAKRCHESPPLPFGLIVEAPLGLQLCFQQRSHGSTSTSRGSEVFQFGMMNPAGAAPLDEAHVDNCRSIKLPTFFRSDPNLWFMQIELMFDCNRIRSERQRAGHIVSVLDYEIVQTISDLLSANPPLERLYTSIKERIITNFSVSPEKELRSILRGEILTDGKPSLILSKIRHLSRGRCSEEIIKAVFLDHLPENCRAILALSEVEDVRRLAQVADKIMANTSSTESTVSAVSTESEVLKKIDALTKRIDEISFKSQPRRDSRSRSFSKNRDKSRNRSGHSRDKSRDQSRDKRHDGSDISLLPADGRSKRRPADYVLYAANNSLINTYGERRLSLNLGLRRPLKWNFCVASVPYAIIGADLLAHYGLNADLRNRRLIDTQTGLGSICVLGLDSLNGISTVNKSKSYAKLLAEFPSITGLEQSSGVAARGVFHQIETTGFPVSERPRRLSSDKLVFAKKKFMSWMDEGKCRPAKDQWASPLHMAPTKDGGYRPCGDYRRVNAQTIPDSYPVPYLQDFTSNLHGRTIFSKLDLHAAYNQIPVAPEDIPKTAITTPFGSFEFLVMTFGLRNAA